MKIYTAFLALLIMMNFSVAQDFDFGDDNTEEKTLFGNREYSSGGYGGPEIRATQIQGEWGLQLGGRGGWIIDHTFSIGGGGYGIVTNHVGYERNDPTGLHDTTYYLRTGYGGLFMEYINSSNEAVHFTVNLLVGAGGAVFQRSIENQIRFDDEFIDDFRESSAYFVFEPGVTADINLTHWFRVAAGVNYRIIAGLEMEHAEDSDLRGLSAGLTFKFGEF